MRFFRSVGEIFGYSPFKPLVEHAILCGRAVGLLQKQFEAYKRSDFPAVEKLRDEIDELESEADKIKGEIRTKVSRSLMLPVDRHDLLEFLKVQDEIINNCEHVGHMLTFRKVKIKESLFAEFEVLLSKIMECANEYEGMIAHVQKLIETSFDKREVEKVIEHVEEVERLEHVCDMIQIGLHTTLFNSEDLHPLDVHIMEAWVVHLGYIANAIARAADRFRLMLQSR
ncbi:MAG: TIGR00153 family protein [Archaeoglobaceae archaeon]|uniref:TIGR00153 family protein n=1 Tax=Archaeoglobus fulgidus TaxID=2234 RepID=A0A7J3M411_ARCFL